MGGHYCRACVTSLRHARGLDETAVLSVLSRLVGEHDRRVSLSSGTTIVMLGSLGGLEAIGLAGGENNR